MAFIPTDEQKTRIDRAQKAFEEARRLPGSPSRYFIDKCSSEAGIEPAHGGAEDTAPNNADVQEQDGPGGP